MKVSVSYLSSNDKKNTIKLIDNSNADYIHVDLMDGIYVNDKNFTISEVIKDLSFVNKKLDVHLMTVNPDKYIDKLSTLNVNNIIFHPSTSSNIINTINLIKSKGIYVGIAINPDENIKDYEKYFDMIDIVLIMGVMPGKGGQEFISDVLNKFDYLATKDILTGVDGGINDTILELLKDKKIDICVSGSYIINSQNMNEQINKIKAIN